MDMKTGYPDSSLFFALMHSLDEAFMGSRGPENGCFEGWGRDFFRLLDREYHEWRTERVAVYTMACELLSRFAISPRCEELVAMIADRPDTLLRTVILLLRQK
ncbi:MAG: hypothetical protein AB9866_31025 [Syntrophobacteraceae bacterium]